MSVLKKRELENLGVPRGEAVRLAAVLAGNAAKDGLTKTDIRNRLMNVIADPAGTTSDEYFADLAKAMTEEKRAQDSYVNRLSPAPWKQWGTDLDETSIQQMENACDLPVAIAGALMPDAHVGYGLPIGGVLATDNSVIPYAVGVDIACRMKMTVLDLSPHMIKSEPDRLKNAIQRETRFGIGANFKNPHDHPVMDEDWSITPVTKQNKGKAWTQLGTSGSGNHFVEFGILTLGEDSDDLGLKAGEYLAVLSHSGSRGAGANTADYYSKLAMRLHPELPKQLRHLAWLDLDTEEGQQYWAAMNLMGKYASANHALIHKMIAKHLKVNVICEVENHHNFAWKETHTDPTTGEKREMIVHRKGATPAAKGVLGIIPGSMASPAYVVKGKGQAESFNSAAHGAGRVMSRTQAKRSFSWSDVNRLLKKRGVTLISAGLDEVPGVYKDIDMVMSQQQDLVDVVARFDPKIVKMAPAGERPED